MAKKTKKTTAKVTTKATTSTKAKAKTETKAKEVKAPVEKVEKVKASTKKKVEAALTDDFLLRNAYHGTREVKKVIGDMLNLKDLSPEAHEFISGLLAGRPEMKKTTTCSEKLRGHIVRIRTASAPKVEFRFVTDSQYNGKLGVGRPMYKGSPTKTKGVALESFKLKGLEAQKNKPDKYQWFNADKHNRQQVEKFMSAVLEA